VSNFAGQCCPIIMMIFPQKACQFAKTLPLVKDNVYSWVVSQVAADELMMKYFLS
jgi:hypothetical protein